MQSKFLWMARQRMQKCVLQPSGEKLTNQNQRALMSVMGRKLFQHWEYYEEIYVDVFYGLYVKALYIWMELLPGMAARRRNFRFRRKAGANAWRKVEGLMGE